MTPLLKIRGDEKSKSSGSFSVFALNNLVSKLLYLYCNILFVISIINFHFTTHKING